MRTKGSPNKPGAAAQSEDQRRQQRALKQQAEADEALREQTRTEVEERPYLDTEGGD